jgi:hypothetical protein
MYGSPFFGQSFFRFHRLGNVFTQKSQFEWDFFAWPKVLKMKALQHVSVILDDKLTWKINCAPTGQSVESKE